MEEIDIDYGLVGELIDRINGDEMGAWFDLPEAMAGAELTKIKNLAETVKKQAEYLVCVGIGGSYLGTRAIYEALGGEDREEGAKLLFTGNSMSSFELKRLLKKLEGHDFCVNVISKSGTTLETALAFRVLKQALEAKYGAEEACKRIIATTDAETGLLRAEAQKKGYASLEIPQGVGGRYSVLSAVGLFPLEVAGIKVERLLEGAKACKQEQLDPKKLKRSMLVSYAFSRFYLYDELGCDTEVLASFEPRMAYFHEWWKQLFGESEGKGGQGIFPVSVIYSTDLHSLGQFMQEGRRNIFETCLSFSPDQSSLTVPSLPEDLDGLEYLAGRKMSEISEIAMRATLKAHEAGGISTFEIQVHDDEAETGISEGVLGFLIFFFETACAMSAMLHGVDPFNQPGVEQYKKEMFRLLKK